MRAVDEKALKPCPFCGGEAERVEIEEPGNEGGACISCKRCGACSAVHFDRKENLDSDWNTRADSQAERLRAALDEECMIVNRLWLILAGDPPPTYEQLGGRSIYDFATDAKTAESRAATLAERVRLLEGALGKCRKRLVDGHSDTPERDIAEIDAVLSATKGTQQGEDHG